MADLAHPTQPDTANRAAPKRRVWMPRHLIAENLWAFGFLGLTLIGLIGLTLVPIVVSFWLSFTDWDALGAPNFVGLDNWIKLFGDPTFLRALWNTVYYTAISVPLGMVLSLGLPLLLKRRLPGIGLFRTVFML